MLRRSIVTSRLYTTKTIPGKTFGEFKNENNYSLNDSNNSNLKDTNATVLSKIKENNMYKNFFQDFEKLKKDAVDYSTKITSFEEQKSFKQVFDYLSKESNKIGMVKSLESFVNIQSPIQKNNQNNSNLVKKSFFSIESTPINLQKQYKLKSDSNKKLMNALLPTLDFINSNFKTSDQLFNFVHNNIFDVFLNNLNKNSLKNKRPIKKFSPKIKYSIDEIKTQSLNSPENPIIDIQTLPILLKFCLNSLTYDFNSISDSLLLIDYIKHHQSIELYGYGLNIDCYNSILIQIWTKTENLSLISSLIEELKINAIKPDLYTFKILSKIYLHCMRVKNSIKSEPYIIWNDSSNIYKIRDYLNDFRFL